MDSDPKGHQASTPAYARLARLVPYVAWLPLVLVLAEWLLSTGSLPQRSHPLLSLLPPLLVGLGNLFGLQRRPTSLLAWATAFAGVAALWLVWANQQAAADPAPWLAALAAAIAIAAYAGGNSTTVGLLARSLGGFLLVLGGLCLFAVFDESSSDRLSLGVGPSLAYMGLGLWLLARVLVRNSARVLRVCTASLAGVSLLVLVGWALHVPYIVRGGTDFVPMQFNSAVCALLIACALRLLAAGRRNLALLFLVPVAGVCIVSLLETYAGIPLDSGEWFFNHEIVMEGMVPGRMAPNTCIAYLLACLGITLAPSGTHTGPARWSATWACGLVITVIALIVLAGYLLQVQFLRGWGATTPIALMTSLSLFLIGMGLGAAGSENRLVLWQRAGWMPLAVAASAMGVTLVVWFGINQDQEASREAALQRQIDLVEQALTRGVGYRTGAFSRTALRLASAPDEATRARVFDVDARIYMSDFGPVINMVWVGPDLVATRQFNRPGRSVPVVGRKLDFDDIRRDLFDLARGSEATVQSPPLYLLDGGVGELLVTAVRRDDEIVGFLVGVVSYQDLFEGELASVAAANPLTLAYGKMLLYSRGTPPPGTDPQLRSIPGQAASLRLSMWPTSPQDSLLGNILLFTGLVTAGLLALALRLAGLARARAEEAELRGRELQDQIEVAGQARAALGEAEQALSRVFESISDAFYTLDQDWRFVFVNKRAEQLMQREPGQLVGQCVWEAFPESRDSIIEEQFRAAASEGHAAEFEVYFAPLEGWFMVRCYPHPTGLAVYFQDISARKRAEDKARQAQATSERAQRMARLGSWELAIDSGEIRLSAEARIIFGLDAAQETISSSDLLSRVHFEDRPRLDAARRRLRSGEESDQEIEYRVLRPDGEVRYVRELGTLLRNAAGEAVTASGAVQDTTESQHAENALRELSRRLEQSLVMNRLVLENSLDVICVLDANGRFTQVSSASEKVWGFKPGELTGRAHFDLAHPDDRAHTLREVAAVLSGRPTVDFRNRLVRKDGQVVSMQWSAVWSARDRLMFAVARDVTEASRQSQALRETKASLQRAQQIARMGAWELDLQKQTLHWSEEVDQIFQVVPGEFETTYQAFVARVPPEDMAMLMAVQAKVIEGQGELNIEHRILLPDGSIGYVQERARLLRDEQGRPHKLAGSVQDVTEFRLAKLALEQERGYLKTVLESLSEGVVACDAEGRLTLFNRSTREMHGLPAEDIPATDWAEHYSLFQADGVTPMALADVPLYRALSGEYVQDAELVIAPRDQPARAVLCSGRQIRSESGKLLGAVVALHDVTHRKRAQELEDGQRGILAGIAVRRPLGDSLMALVRLAEKQMPGAISSILLLDEAGLHVKVGAAPNLPSEFNAAIHGLPIGPKAGSCGTAAYRGERVIVSDIDSDPLWSDYRPLVQPHGLKACWSTPVKSSDGRVIATFATYYHELREPVAHELELIDGLAALCAVAIEHDAAFQSITNSQQRFRSLFDEHPDIVYSLDLQGRFTEINEQFQRVDKRGPEEVLGHDFEAWVLESEREVVRAHFKAACQGEARSYEMTGVTSDSTRVEVRITNLPIIVNGRVTGVFGIAQDISLLRKHQRELSNALDDSEALTGQLQRLSEASIAINRGLDEGSLYQQLVDHMREIVGAHQAVVSVRSPTDSHVLKAVSLSEKYARWRDYDTPVDGSGIYAMVDERQEAVRMTQQELEAHPRWKNFGAESDRHPPMRGWLAVPMVGSDGETLGVLQLSDKNRGEFNEDDELVVLQFSQMAVVAIERARLLAKLQVRDRFFEMSLEVFVVYDPATRRWVQVNQMLADISGYSREELCSRPIFDFIHPDDIQAANDRSSRLEKGQPVDASFVNRYLRRDGSIRWMEWMSTPAPDGLVYGVGRDITQRMQAEGTLRQTLADLNARNRELQDFAFIASHDLQEPLRKIRAFADRLQQRHAESLAAEARDYLDRTSHAASRMQVLINDLLAYSRVAARGKPFSQVKLDTVMAGVVDDLEASLEASGGRVEAGPLPTIEADPTQMRQLFQNLLSNALKFRSPDRQVVIEVSAEREEGVDGAGWILRFQDNGIGFEPRHAEKVFAPFQRLHARQEYEGTGIGLAIVRRIVERHRGTIQAQGRPGEGATFLIWLPEQQPADAGGVAIPLSGP